MKQLKPIFALASVISAGCHAQISTEGAGGCPPFPPASFNQKGGAFASTSFGGSKMHSPPAIHTAIPTGPIETVRIALERSGCFGTCPSYHVEIRGTGEVLFHSDGFVTFPGDHRTRVSPQVVQCLLSNFRTVDFWSLDPEYAANVTDLPTYRVSLTIGGQTKVLTDYAGQSVGMPPEVTALEQAIDLAASTETWIKGDNRTIQALEAEGFDFKSRAAADLLAAAAQDAPDSIVFALLDRGAPLDGVSTESLTEEPMSAIEAAAMYGRLELVRRLIRAGAFSNGRKSLVTATLRASVASESAAMVGEILRYHPDVNGRDKRGETALMLIFTGAHPHGGDESYRRENPAIIRLLGKAGADPNILTSDGEHLLDHAYSEEDKEALRAIGARRH